MDREGLQCEEDQLEENEFNSMTGIGGGFRTEHYAQPSQPNLSRKLFEIV